MTVGRKSIAKGNTPIPIPIPIPFVPCPFNMRPTLSHKAEPPLDKENANCMFHHPSIRPRGTYVPPFLLSLHHLPRTCTRFRCWLIDIPFLAQIHFIIVMHEVLHKKSRKALLDTGSSNKATNKIKKGITAFLSNAGSLGLGCLPYSTGVSLAQTRVRLDLGVCQLSEMLGPNPSDHIFRIILILCKPQLALFSDHIEDLTRTG